jgi:hypothetical protein
MITNSVACLDLTCIKKEKKYHWNLNTVCTVHGVNLQCMSSWWHRLKYHWLNLTSVSKKDLRRGPNIRAAVLSGVICR